MTIFTIGHSNRPADAFVALLREAGVDLVVDVRAIPKSRANPQFAGDALRQSLMAHGIGYRHLGALGGRRGRGPEPSPNAYWREAGFRNYADYAMTPPFRAALNALEGLAAERTVAVMCAEAVWWRCHRQIIADYLLADGLDVRHILGPGKIEPARRNAAAERQEEGALVYRPQVDDLPLFGGQPARR